MLCSLVPLRRPCFRSKQTRPVSRTAHLFFYWSLREQSPFLCATCSDFVPLQVTAQDSDFVSLQVTAQDSDFVSLQVTAQDSDFVSLQVTAQDSDFVSLQATAQDSAQLVERHTERPGAILTRVRVPDAARDYFSQTQLFSADV